MVRTLRESTSEMLGLYEFIHDPNDGSKRVRVLADSEKKANSAIHHFAYGPEEKQPRPVRKFFYHDELSDDFNPVLAPIFQLENTEKEVEYTFFVTPKDEVWPSDDRLAGVMYLTRMMGYHN